MAIYDSIQQLIHQSSQRKKHSTLVLYQRHAMLSGIKRRKGEEIGKGGQEGEEGGARQELGPRVRYSSISGLVPTEG